MSETIVASPSDIAREHRAFRVSIYAIAGGILAFATAQIFYARGVGNRQLFIDGVDWVYDVLLYGLAAAVFGRGEKAERISALLIAGIMVCAALNITYELREKIIDPQPVDPLILGFSSVSAVVIALLVVGALWRFRRSVNALIMATWLSSRNDVIKTIFNSAFGVLEELWQQRWLEYSLDVFAIFLCFQAAWRIVWEARRNARAEVGAPPQSN